LEVFLLHWAPFHLSTVLISACVRLPNNELHVKLWAAPKREQHPLAQPPGLVFGSLDGLGRHTMQASNQPTAGGEVELPIEAAGTASDAVILHAAHED
jgi:hypothetical protein